MLIEKHESLIAQSLHLTRTKDVFFKDFWGEIKSLGAWGGDFVLATSSRGEEETRMYFAEKGFDVILTYTEMIKASEQEERNVAKEHSTAVAIS
jgi:hypothetical protein